MNTLGTGSGTVTHSLADRGRDLYETPPIAVDKLFQHVTIEKDRPILEPACGRGAISRELEQRGYNVYSSDIECKYENGYTIDFFDVLRAPADCFLITNPPYALAQQFIEHAIALKIERSFFLLRLAFLESERRSPILDTGHLASVMVFKKRLPFMHRDGWQGPRSNSSAIPFAWFEFTAKPTNTYPWLTRI